MAFWLELRHLFTQENYGYTCDLIGVAACAAAGATLARSKDFDIIGALWVATVASVGGGTTRDVLLGRHPLFWMTDLTYMGVILVTTLAFYLFSKVDNLVRVQRLLTFMDAIGLSIFTLIGIKAAVSVHANGVIVVIMGMITAVVGGILRDIICRETPMIFKGEIYASASLLGGVAYFLLDYSHQPYYVRDNVAFMVIFTLRLVSVQKGWRFPRIGLSNKPSNNREKSA